MKKQTKKLVLSKETLVHLEDLGLVAGGAESTLTGCPTYTGLRTCATCGATCTTNRC